MTHDCLVIGSGPSGVACARALLDAGRSVLMIDGGRTLEPARAEMLTNAPRPLTPATAPWLKEPAPPSRVPRKLIYGSDYPFRDAAEGLRIDAESMGAEPSFAQGGLSAAWGASALPFAAEDTRDWPVSAEDLAPHYAACAEMLGLTGADDDLADWLPNYAPPRAPMPLSAQAQTVQASLTRNRDALREAGVRYGRARVAAKAEACAQCGLCLHGCPDKLIWSAADTLAALRAHPKFSYRGGAIVSRVTETAEGAIAHAEGEEIAARSLFLAAGALASTAMLLRSKQAVDHTLRMLDSQYFLLPLMLCKGDWRAHVEELHTMAQLFLELRDAAISPHTVHLQLYTYNSLMSAAMRQRLGPLAPLARFGDAHFVLIQGYLHSDQSGAIEVTLRGDDRIQARGVPNPAARTAINALVSKFTKLAPKLGAVPLAPLMEITEPGRGFHIGGSMPMRAAPDAFETDTLGRPFGWSRVHVVDATVLPSIPATTITYPVMANAHRIGAQAGKAA